MICQRTHWECAFLTVSLLIQEAAVEMAWKNIKLAFGDKVGDTWIWAPMSREHFEHEIQSGSMYVECTKLLLTHGFARVGRLIWFCGEQPAAAADDWCTLLKSSIVP